MGGIELFHDQSQLFDLITLSHVIEHVHYPIDLLRACHRLLKPGGVLWLETPNIKSYGHRFYGRFWRGLEPPRHLVIFSPSGLFSILNDTGFVNIEQKNRALSTFFSFPESERLFNLTHQENHSNTFSIKARLMLRFLYAEILETIVPYYREFLTIIAVKSK